MIGLKFPASAVNFIFSLKKSFLMSMGGQPGLASAPNDDVPSGSGRSMAARQQCNSSTAAQQQRWVHLQEGMPEKLRVSQKK